MMKKVATKEKKTCAECGTEMICPKCDGARGGKKTARKYSAEQRREWGKLGGRPEKEKGGASNKDND